LNTSNSKRILVVGPAWVGDMVMAQSLFMALKKHNSNAIIDVLAPQWSIELIERMPEVSNAISLSVNHGQLDLKLRYTTGVNLRNNNYHQAIITPRSIKSALVPFFAKIPQRTGYRGEHRYGIVNDIRALDKTRLTQTVQRYTFLASESKDNTKIPEIFYPKLSINQSGIDEILNKLSLNCDKPIIALLPGAEYGPSKQWPIAYFKKLAVELVNRGYQVWVLGSNKDVQSGDQIVSAECQQHFNICGKTSLVDVVDLLSLVKYAITNDSGLMHVACATNTKVLSIYGSSSPLYTPPLHEDAVVLYKNLQCSPCFERRCRFGHTNCLNEITIEDVIKHVK